MQDTTLQPQLAEAVGPPCVGTPQPLRSLFANAARKHPNNTAVASLYQQCMPALPNESRTVTENLVWTYKQLDETSDLLAAAFHDRGIRKGMRICWIKDSSHLTASVWMHPEWNDRIQESIRLVLSPCT